MEFVKKSSFSLLSKYSTLHKKQFWWNLMFIKSQVKSFFKNYDTTLCFLFWQPKVFHFLSSSFSSCIFTLFNKFNNLNFYVDPKTYLQPTTFVGSITFTYPTKPYQTATTRRPKKATRNQLSIHHTNENDTKTSHFPLLFVLFLFILLSVSSIKHHHLSFLRIITTKKVFFQ